MSKIKLTEEQVEALYRLLDKSHLILEDAIYKYVHNKLEESEIILKELTLDDLINALYIGYEVVDRFEVDDWVVIEDCLNERIVGKTQKISIIQDTGYKDKIITYEDGWSYLSKTKIRKATKDEIEKELKRRKWNNAGREVDDYRVGDVIRLGSLNSYYRIIEIDSENGKVLFLDECSGLHSVSKCKVHLVCPVEQRLDLK